MLVQSGRAGRRLLDPRMGAAGPDRELATWCRDWATWPEFRRLEALGLTMYGQMTAGSWIYIGTQGILQGTYETFAAVAEAALRRHARGHADAHGRAAAGMGGAQPLAVTMNGGVVSLRRRRPVALAAPRRPALPRRDGRPTSTRRVARVRGGEARAAGPERRARRQRRDGLRRAARARRRGRHRHRPDLGARSAQLPARGHRPRRLARLRRQEARGVHRPRAPVDGQARRGDGRLQGRGAPRSSTTATRIRGEAQLGGYERAFGFPGFVPAYIRPLFCEGKGPFRWAALSGDPARHRRDRPGRARPLPRQRGAAPLDHEGRRTRSPSRGCPRASAGSGTASATRPGSRFNELVATGEVSAPIVIGRDHLDSGSVASPYRETESMLDGSDAIADWPLLNALVNTASGATWVSIHHGGGVGIGRSIHAGPGLRRRRHGALGAEARRVLTQRSRHGRHPPRRRRLRDRRARRRGARRADPDARVADDDPGHREHR